MARIRTIKPEFWDSPGTARASLRARLFFIAMWNWADDYGVGTANPNQLVAFAFPNDDIDTRTEFPCLRAEVSDCYGVVWYEVENRPYYYIPSWDDHQKNERRAKGRFPKPDQGKLVDTEVPCVSTEVQALEQRNRGTGEQGNSNPPNPPRGNRGQRLSEDWRPSQRTVDTIAGEYPGFDYGREHKRFVDYWIAQPGQRGVKLDWDATWRNWMRRKGDEGGGAVVSRLPVGKQSAGDKARAIADEFRREGL